MQHRAVVSAREARRTAPPPASTTHHGSRSPFVGDTPSRAGPRLPGPFGRSRLSAGAAQSSAPQRRAALAVSEAPPRLIRKRRKGELKHARSKHKNKGRKKKKKKKKKDQVNNKKKQGGQNGKVNACAPVSFSRRSR